MWHYLFAGLAMAGVMGLPVDAAAQQRNRFYVGGLIGNHHESADFASGDTTSVGFVGGAWITRSLGVEVEVSRPTRTLAHEYEGFSVSFAAPGATRDEIERLAVFSRFTHQRTVNSALSVGVVHAAEFNSRWSTRLFAGVTNRHVEERSVLTPLRVPAGLTPVQLASVRTTDDRFTRNLGGLTVGGGVAFAATRHLSIAPDLRYDYGSIGDEINNALRTSVRITWNF